VSGRTDPDRLALLVHELRSPTAALEAIAEVLVHGKLGAPDRKELVRLAVRACLSIERIVVDASYQRVDARTVDLGTLVGDVAAQATLDGALVEVDVDPRTPLVRGDELRLGQALGNLVANARVHSGTSAAIVIGTRAREDWVDLFVEDVGRGVPASERERIVQPGVRLDPKRPGSGLGLAIVRAIAEAHGGRLLVESEPGSGSTFTIALPVT
jgi:signal transduction histidine kinase